MGKPLKPAWRETPILYGEDARRFMKRMENPPKWSKEKKEDFRLKGKCPWMGTYPPSQIS